MGWRNRNWPERTLRPKVAKLPREALQRLHARAVKFVEESLILCELVDGVQLARGRLYLWREPNDLMARITLLGSRSMLLESPGGNSWIEHGQLATVLKVLEGDTRGTFHGLGSLVAKQRGGKPSAQVVLPRGFQNTRSRPCRARVLVLDASQACDRRGQRREGPRARPLRRLWNFGPLPRDVSLCSSRRRVALLYDQAQCLRDHLFGRDVVG